ncbi:MAG: NAD-dependent epimerase/dehydratase family protein, partial [Bacteroidota bacterium]
MSKVVAITGAGGFIGKYLVRFFKQQGFIVYEVHRNDFFSTSTLSNKINDADYVINLAGKSVFTRWTSKNKKAILNSRISTTKKIVEVLNGKKKPVHLLNASAIGIYSYKQVHDEESKDYAGNFLTDMVLAWEQEAEKLQYDQLTIMRFSVVLGREGGAFKTLRMFNKLRIGNYFGDGKQPFPFIHIYDLACAVLYLMNHQIKS